MKNRKMNNFFKLVLKKMVENIIRISAFSGKIILNIVNIMLFNDNFPLSAQSDYKKIRKKIHFYVLLHKDFV